MPLRQLRIDPIERERSLRLRTYDMLKSVLIEADIYADDAELRMDERDLSRRLGVSRTPLREAVAKLKSEGWLEVVPRRGIFIIRKSKAEILNMITVWAALESMAARLATKHASDEDIGGLHNLVGHFQQEAVDDRLGEYSDANINFHQSIIRLGSCSLITETTNTLFPHIRAIRRRTIHEMDRARRSIADHREIIAAIEARDTERAERLVRDHTLKLRDHVDRYVEIG